MTGTKKYRRYREERNVSRWKMKGQKDEKSTDRSGLRCRRRRAAGAAEILRDLIIRLSRSAISAKFRHENESSPGRKRPNLLFLIG